MRMLLSTFWHQIHEIVDAEGQLILCDIGHYESEIFTKELLGEFLSQNFPNNLHSIDKS